MIPPTSTDGDNVTSIGDYVFDSCTILTSITIPDSVELIVDLNFYNRSALTDIYYTGSEEEWAIVNHEWSNIPANTTSTTITYLKNNFL